MQVLCFCRVECGFVFICERLIEQLAVSSE